MDERWQQLKDVFIAASEMPENERGSFIQNACGGDPEFLAEIRSLLEAHQEADHFIENGIDLASTFEGIADSSGKVFGSYTIIREIGRGGMGAVFLAERSDGEFRQTVALKIIRQTIVDAEAARRFRRERSILALLNHPNIAALYDGGVSDLGEPYFAMEYVDGLSLLDHSLEKNLTIEEKLRLFLKILAAVDYAHRNLTVHRDLKPSNILVTKSGEPKLLDFGLAKILDEDLDDKDHTATQLRAFTPAYASPEQMIGKKVTTATDIYSLGVVLYEMLVGRKPFDLEGKDLREVIDTVTNHEPTPPSRIAAAATPGTSNNGLKGDLDMILMLAIRKEPERRYRSVEAFADDIERHLSGQPISARPNTISYLASKFISRNKIAVTAAAIVLVTLVAGLVSAMWEARVARIERDRAEKHFQNVRQLSNSLLFELSPKIEELQGATEAREILVKRALEYLDSLASESQNDPQLQAELASAYEKIGDLQGNPTNPNLIDFDAAIQSYEKAKQIRSQLTQSFRDEPDSLRKLAENERVLGNIYHQTNEIALSEQNMNAAMEIYQRLIASSPAAAERQLDLAKINYDIGLNLQAAKSYERSLAYFSRSQELLARVNAQTPGSADVLKMTAEVKAQNAIALSWAKRQPEAEAELKDAIAILEPVFAANSNNVSVRGSMWLIYWLASSIYQDQNDPLAYEYAKKALAIVDETVKKDDSNIRAKQQLAKSYSTLGETAITIGKAAEAIEYLEKACRMQSEITQNTTKNARLKSDLAISLTRLGEAKAKQALYEDSLANLTRAEKIYQDVIQSNPADRRSYRNLALTYEEIGNTYKKLFEKKGRTELRDLARSNFQSALDIYVSLDEKNELTSFDRKSLAELRTTLAK